MSNSNPILANEGKVIINVLKIILKEPALVTSLKILPNLNILKVEVYLPTYT